MKASDSNIKGFVGGLDKVFLIPPFQRNYAWDKKNCKELWNDFENCIRTNETHFLGNILYYPSENSGASYSELILVDGQQRLTTVLLLLTALRDKTSDIGLKNDIDTKYLKNSTSDNRYRIKLKSIANDSDNFIKIVDGDIENSSSLLHENYLYFCDRVLSLNTSDHWKLFNAIARCEIVDINLQAGNNLSLVQTVFEKINSTGKALTPADLIRNLLLVTDSPEEQKNLYINYWQKIESILGAIYIPDFVSDYLIINTSFSSISSKEVYSKFKEYKESNKLSNKDSLETLLNYSKYYSFLIGKPCGNSKIAKSIEEINLQKASDLYPILLHCLYIMFENQQQELVKIFELFSDFILRYRIVRDYSGGGALQGMVRQIINKLLNSQIKYTYADLLVELSNSTTRDGEFPTDTRFEESLLTKSFNRDDAKLLLSRIEYYQNKDVQIPFNKLTLEHIMPETLSMKWKQYLGLADEKNVFDFQSEYLWKLGNLTLLSGPLNSQLQNDVFDNKVQSYANNQFRITRSINKYNHWRRDEIVERTSELASIATKATISPIPRTRPYQKDTGKSYQAGEYFISESEIILEGSKPKRIIFNNESWDCKNWNKLFLIICEKLYLLKPNQFDELVINNVVHKSTKSKVENGVYNLNYDPMIHKDSSLFQKATKIKGTDYYCESVLSNIMARKHSVTLINALGFDDIDFIVEVS